jgi:DivIVA domain-containing protein
VATIYLAHAPADRDRARALAAGLGEAGYQLLPDPEPTGDNGWWAGVLAAVQGADIFLYATSPHSVTVPALRDYVAAIGIPAVEVHLSGEQPATGVDFRRPTAEAAFRLVGALAALPPRPPFTGWQPAPDNPFARLADLARGVQDRSLTPADQRAVAARLAQTAFDPAARELAAALRLRTDLDPATARHLDETFPQTPAGTFPQTPAGTFPQTPTGPVGAPAGPVGAPAGPVGAPQAASAPWRPVAGLSPDDVRRIAFRKAPFGRRGYDEEQVDVLLDQVESDLRARHTGGPVVRVRLTARDVHDAAFSHPPRGKRGYNEEEVDAFLHQIQKTFADLDQALIDHGSTIVQA